MSFSVCRPQHICSLKKENEQNRVGWLVVGFFVFFLASPQPPICACVHKYPDERLPLRLACGKGGRRVDKERFSARVGDTLPPLPATSFSSPSPRRLTLSSFSALLPLPSSPCPPASGIRGRLVQLGGRKSPSPRPLSPAAPGGEYRGVLPGRPQRSPRDAGG